MPGRDRPGDERVAVTREASRRTLALFDALLRRGVERAQAQRFVLRCVLGMFAERPGEAGGPLAHAEPLDLTPGEAALLAHAAAADWPLVEPPIFGELFQRSIGAPLRHALGAHFTSEAEIQKVVTPTIVRPWRERIARAGTAAELSRIGRELSSFRVLDPSCGSGNFLYVAYRELKRIEIDLLARLRERHEPSPPAISVRQLHGIDIDPLAVELAKVELLLAERLAAGEARAALGGLARDAPPLAPEDLGDTIRCDDALFCAWPEADAIIGNPPYQSKNKAQRELGPAYMSKLRRAYPGVPGHADYCVYWFRRAHDELREGGRAGLVGTNTIRQNSSRAGGLDHIVANGGTITEAVSTQPWPGDAVVHVSIVNWVKGHAGGDKTLHRQVGDGAGAPWETYTLPAISAALSPRVDLATAKDIAANLDPKTTFQGQTPGHTEGLVVSPALAQQWIRDDPANAEVLFAYLIGDDLLDNPDSAPSRVLVDFGERDLAAARRYRRPFEHVERLVLPAREAAARDEAARNAEALARDPKARVNRHHASFLRHWWRLSFRRDDMLAALARQDRYIAVSRVTRRPVFQIVPGDVRPGDALQVFALDDDYAFGILQSDLHWQWFTERCSGLKIDPRYTSASVYSTFPWPQQPAGRDVLAVGAAGQALRALRRSILKQEGIGLRALYGLLEQQNAHPLAEAHRALDDAVRAAYGMRREADPLAFLLALNREVAARAERGERGVGPGRPPL